MKALCRPKIPPIERISYTKSTNFDSQTYPTKLSDLTYFLINN